MMRSKNLVVLSFLISLISCGGNPPPVVTPPPIIIPPPIDPPIEPELPTFDENQIRSWQGAISLPCEGVPQLQNKYPLLFTAQGFDSIYNDEQRKAAINCYKNNGYTHWAYGPILQRGYPNSGLPDTDFRSNPEQFIERAQELIRANIIPGLFLLDDFCVYACEHGGINREKVEAELTPLFSREDFQKTFGDKIIVLGWEPQWRTRDFEWASQWARRIFPNAYIYIHLPSNRAAPGRHEDFISNGGEFEFGSDMWNVNIPHIDGFLMQETFTFTGDEVGADRTREQQYVYDLMDRSRRFRYGRGPNAPTTGPEVIMWQANWGSDHKAYNAWDGTYLLTNFRNRPMDIVSFEYCSYVLKQNASLEPECKSWGQTALTVNGIFGFGDGG